jgi:probable HAF family extracellular repeat protein
VGFWADANGDNFGFVEHDGKFRDVVDPNAPKSAPGTPSVQQLLGVNDRDVAVGFYVDAGGNSHGFTYNIGNGRFDAVNIKGFSSVTATAINNKGDIAGFVQNGANDEGFFKDGNKVELLTGPKGAVSVQALGVNNEDEVVGSFTDAAGNTHGFLFNDKTHSYTTIDDPNANGMTVVNGLNDKGQLVGFYLDKAGNTDGMLVQVSSHHS